MKNNVKALAFAGVLITGSAFASEYRTPYLSERGPLRYDFFKLPKEEDCSWWFNMWSSVYHKESKKAFMKHGTNTEPLSALIFNKADFQFQDAFYNGEVPYNSENYNPFFKILTYSPRVEHHECGMNFGGRVEMPVWGNKGRVGIRFNLPFRSVEVERKDDTDKLQDPREQVVSSRYVNVDKNSLGLKQDQARQVFDQIAPILGAGGVGTTLGLNNVAPGGTAAVLNAIDTQLIQPDVLLPETKLLGRAILDAANNAVADLGATDDQLIAYINVISQALDRAAEIASQNVRVDAYRSDFVRNIIDEVHKSEVVGGVNRLDMFTVPVVAENIIPIGIIRDLAVGLSGSNSVGEPLMHAFMVDLDPAAPMDRHNLCIGSGNIKEVTEGAPSTSSLSYFNGLDNIDYAKVLADWEKQLKKCECPNGDGDSKYWVIFRRQSDAINANPKRFGSGMHDVSGDGQSIDSAIQDRLPIYDTHPLLQLWKCGIEFESDKRCGIGDLDIDLFYEHMFCEDSMMAELVFGVRFPTAGGSDSNRSGNPYRAHLGNGGHFEIKLGAGAAWQPLDWMGLKADAYWSFVLEASERRMATFCGSCVKNIGPCVKADVDWGYFVGRLDLNFFHPETSDINGVFGYEFYYKTEDHVNFKCKELESCLGGRYETTTNAGVVTKTFVSNPRPLGKKEAEKNTERISHKIRTEASYRLCKYMDIYAGGGYVFAGQNAPREYELHAGWNVRF